MDELGQLNKQGHELYLEVTSLLELLRDDMTYHPKQHGTTHIKVTREITSPLLS